MPSSSLTTKQILQQLDECSDANTFPVLDNETLEFIDARMLAYSDGKNWAIVFQVVGCDPEQEPTICLYCFGNCLKCEIGISNDNLISLLDDPSLTILDEDLHVRDDVREIKIRGHSVQVLRDELALKRDGIDTNAMRIVDLMRVLLPNHRNILFATETELRKRVPARVPLILQIEEWNHPDLVTLPSTTETFQLLAKALVAADPKAFAPTLLPNTNWRNWKIGEKD